MTGAPPGKGRTGRRRRAAVVDATPVKRPAPTPISPRLRLQLLDDSELQRIHEASLEILTRTGVVFGSALALDHFRRAGTRVDGKRVFIDADLLDRCVASAPSQYRLRGRNRVHDVLIGGDACAVMPGGGAPFVRDLDGARRPGTLKDLENLARLSAVAPQIHVAARKAVEAQDIPVSIRHLKCWCSMIEITDKPIQSGFSGGRAEVDDVLGMLAIAFGGEAEIQGSPVMHCSVNVNSPLTFDTAMVESLIRCAEYGQPVLISPFVMAGVTGPTTLAGAIAQQNAEVLAGVVLTQLVRLGTPVLYGTASSNVDMRSAAPAIGSPESALSIALCAQLARHYRLPCRGGGALTDSPVPDAQSQYERMFTLMVSFLSGVNYLMHGVGILESYLTMSFEQFVIDLELIDTIHHFSKPLEISEETLALDTIHAVGPGGYFLDAAHTLQRYRDAFFMPAIGIRSGFEQWEAAGGVDALTRANRRCRELLATYEPPSLADGIRDRLHDYVDARSRVLLARGT